ncbi:unnamed protein product [Cladocopium goreaui]|uniref:Uncharacterized protein n=1 Tax=Cladocopium goreaui TaxID=2562237 RepID=A0A9P1GGM2_9DINO|nr:unnamed protein product [Cladocopium goreaui]
MQHVDAALHLLKHAAVRTKADFPKPSLKLTLYLDDLVGGRHHVSSERGEARTLHSHEAAVQTDKGPYLSTVAGTVANNVGGQMEPLLVLLKQAQDHSEALEQRCHDLEARQSVFQERAIQISPRHVGCRADIPAEDSRLARETLKTNGATSQPSMHVDVQPAAVRIDPSELKQLRRERRRRELLAMALGRYFGTF